MLSTNRPYNVLLVEDNPDQAALIERWMRSSLHCTLQIERDGAAGIRRAAEGGWDLLVSDVELPHRSGIAVLKASKDLFPDTPALILTAHKCVETTVDALRAHANDVLFKPFEPSSLIEKADTLLRAPRATRQRQSILAIGAHFDDVEIGCGGSLLRHASQGDNIVSLVLTNGSKGGESAQRRKESETACKRINAELICGGLHDTYMTDGPETIAVITDAIERLKPDIVYTHSHNDVHQDHRATHRASVIAARNVSNVFCYESPSTTTDFSPSRFIDVDRHMEDKVSLLATYESQSNRPYLAEDVIRSTARYWGRFSRYGMVEALEVIRASELHYS